MALKEFVYTDESGTHSGSAWCVVAGYRASPGQWQKFNAEWRGVLRKYNVCLFHSKEYFNRKTIKDPKHNPYLHWPDKKATSYLNDLLKVISGRRIYPVGCAVDVKAFESYSYGERCILAGYVTKASRRKSRDPVPYHAAFRATLVDALDSAASGAALHIFIAGQIEYQQRAGEEYMLAKELSEDRRVDQLKTFGIRAPIDEPALQAADLLAGRWYNFSLRGRQRLNAENVTIMNILTKKRNDMPKLDAAAFERLFAAAGVTESQRATIREYK